MPGEAGLVVYSLGERSKAMTFLRVLPTVRARFCGELAMNHRVSCDNRISVTANLRLTPEKLKNRVAAPGCKPHPILSMANPPAWDALPEEDL